jgi:hypothetical protein
VAEKFFFFWQDWGLNSEKFLNTENDSEMIHSTMHTSVAPPYGLAKFHCYDMEFAFPVEEMAGAKGGQSGELLLSARTYL